MNIMNFVELLEDAPFLPTECPYVAYDKFDNVVHECDAVTKIGDRVILFPRTLCDKNGSPSFNETDEGITTIVSDAGNSYPCMKFDNVVELHAIIQSIANFNTCDASIYAVRSEEGIQRVIGGDTINWDDLEVVCAEELNNENGHKIILRRICDTAAYKKAVSDVVDSFKKEVTSCIRIVHSSGLRKSDKKKIMEDVFNCLLEKEEERD